MISQYNNCRPKKCYQNHIISFSTRCKFPKSQTFLYLTLLKRFSCLTQWRDYHTIYFKFKIKFNRFYFIINSILSQFNLIVPHRKIILHLMIRPIASSFLEFYYYVPVHQQLPGHSDVSRIVNIHNYKTKSHSNFLNHFK